MLRTRTPPLANCGLPSFTFAGFTWPRYVATLPRGSLARRLQQRKPYPATGDYYHAPTPDNRNGIGFYLDSDGMPGLRWQWADDIVSRLPSGYYCDRHGDQTIRGVVFRLPRGRGFLAGWSMGEGMASSLDFDIFDSAEDAARAADSMAESAAEAEREASQDDDGE